MLQEIEIQKMLDVKDKKSLGYLMLYLYDRWEEEKTYEDFMPYQIYLKNVLRKHTPKRTKFVEFNKEPFCLTVYLQGVKKQCEITVKNRNLIYNLN